MFKYADDSNLLVPAYSGISILSEFEHLKQWAADNKIMINLTKTKEIIFQHPRLEAFSCFSALCGIKEVTSA